MNHSLFGMLSAQVWNTCCFVGGGVYHSVSWSLSSVKYKLLLLLCSGKPNSKHYTLQVKCRVQLHVYK